MFPRYLQSQCVYSVYTFLCKYISIYSVCTFCLYCLSAAADKYMHFIGNRFNAYVSIYTFCDDAFSYAYKYMHFFCVSNAKSPILYIYTFCKKFCVHIAYAEYVKQAKQKRNIAGVSLVGRGVGEKTKTEDIF